MKKTFMTTLLLSAFIFGNAAAFCDVHSIHLKKPEVSKGSQLIEAVEKIYINLQDVLFQEKSMYANVNNNWIPINALHLDEQGYYIADSWVCGYCTKETTSNPWTCDHCNRRRK